MNEGRLIYKDTRDTKNEESAKVSSKSNDQFCSDPIKKGKVEFPDSVAGRTNIDFEMYSGYVGISDAPDYLFYWFFGTKDKNESAPLIIWTNGCPGCSAMEGLQFFVHFQI